MKRIAPGVFIGALLTVVYLSSKTPASKTYTSAVAKVIEFRQ